MVSLESTNDMNSDFAQYKASRRWSQYSLRSLLIGATIIAVIGGWIGGELVYRLSVGVDFDAHVNSPSSLSSRPASDNKETLPASQR